MLSRVLSYALNGLDGYLVEIDTDISAGFMRTDIVGLGDMAVKEAKDRVLPAIENSGFDYPTGKVVTSLAPAAIKKEGSGFDVGIAVGILTAARLMKGEKDMIYLGELSLGGKLREVTGVLPLLISARAAGYKRFVIPSGNALEASYVEGVQIYKAETLRDIVAGRVELVLASKYESNQSGGDDFKYVKGQPLAKRAIEIAVSGGHNILMSGPPGSGKTMLAKCIPSIMPPMDFDEALEVTKIHSICGMIKEGIVSIRPFRSPHHTTSAVAFTGGGRRSTPGEFSLAHQGVLFLDELPEYARNTLETLRQPLEDRKITVSRASGSVTYPCDFMLVASQNPCPCGNLGNPKKECVCTAREIEKYRNRISSPLLDRIDLNVEVGNVEYEDISSKSEAESSADICARVIKSRDLQKKRQGKCNDSLRSEELNLYCELDEESEKILSLAFARFHLSARGVVRIKKVARTIADMSGSENIQKNHILEAVQYRATEKRQV